MNFTYNLYLVIRPNMKNRQARQQRLVVRYRMTREEERKMGEEEKDRSRFENLGAGSILKN